MRYHQVTETCFAAAIGEGGLSEAAFATALKTADTARGRLKDVLGSGGLPALGLAAQSQIAQGQTGGRDDLAAARSLAVDWRERLAEVVVLGTGGSSLGGQTLTALADSGFGPARGGPRLHYLDSVDPHSCAALLAELDLSRTGVLAISKSGGTAETLAQSLILLPALEAAVGRPAMPRHAVVITEPKPSPLLALAQIYGLPCLDHDPEIGGRYSVLSVVGLLPAMIAGLDAGAIRQGAAEALGAALEVAAIEDSAPAVGAAIAVGLLRERRIGQSILMTYVDRLAPLGLWYRQLWAESLGKDGAGTTPIPARGTTDHHSQLQLYLAGPRDKMFTLIMPDTLGQGPTMDATLATAVGAGELAGRTLGDLLHAAARATAETLVNNGRPVRRIRIEEPDEATLGALVMHFMLETVIAADLLGVNAFDQPAVEEGKVLTRAYLKEAPNLEETPE